MQKKYLRVWTLEKNIFFHRLLFIVETENIVYPTQTAKIENE